MMLASWQKYVDFFGQIMSVQLTRTFKSITSGSQGRGNHERTAANDQAHGRLQERMYVELTG